MPYKISLVVLHPNWRDGSRWPGITKDTIKETIEEAIITSLVSTDEGDNTVVPSCDFDYRAEGSDSQASVDICLGIENVEPTRDMWLAVKEALELLTSPALPYRVTALVGA